MNNGLFQSCQNKAEVKNHKKGINHINHITLYVLDLFGWRVLCVKTYFDFKFGAVTDALQLFSSPERLIK